MIVNVRWISNIKIFIKTKSPPSLNSSSLPWLSEILWAAPSDLTKPMPLVLVPKTLGMSLQQPNQYRVLSFQSTVAWKTPTYNITLWPYGLESGGPDAMIGYSTDYGKNLKSTYSEVRLAYSRMLTFVWAPLYIYKGYGCRLSLRVSLYGLRTDTYPTLPNHLSRWVQIWNSSVSTTAPNHQWSHTKWKMNTQPCSFLGSATGA